VTSDTVTVIGGGLAGCEAAWQLGRRGVRVRLHEQRPHNSGPAHHTSMLAELVCSNSLRGAALENAVGLLKEELARLDSLIVGAARAAAVPAGGALAVDREHFSGLIESRLRALGTVEIVREEVTEIPAPGPAIVACGPLPSDRLAAAIDRLVGGERLHYYDAAAPIVAAESIEPDVAYKKSRYDKGDGADYLNLALDRARSAARRGTIRKASRATPPAGRSRTSKAVCRSRSWRCGARTRCGSGRSSRSGYAIRAPGKHPTLWFSSATRTPPERRSTWSASKPA
jgi:tRNA:m(5)U-54 methyltransferase